AAGAGAIDELVADHEIAGPHVPLQAAGRARAEQPTDADRPHRPDVGAVVHRVRGVLVTTAVPGHKGHAPALDLADVEHVARRPVGRLDAVLLGVLEQAIETRPPEDPDLGQLLARLAHPHLPGRRA